MSFYEYLSLKSLSLPLHSVDNCWFLDATEAPWEALWVFGLHRLSPVMNGNMCTCHHIINLLLCERKHTKNGAKLESEPHHTYEAEVFWKYDRLSTNMDKLRDKEQFTEVSHNNMGMSNILTNVAPNVSVCCCSCLGVFYHSFKQAAYLLFLYKSLYLFGSALVYSTEVSASRTQTLKTDYCVTNV